MSLRGDNEYKLIFFAWFMIDAYLNSHYAPAGKLTFPDGG